MERIQTITHKSKNIVLIDLSNLKPPETVQIIPSAKKTISTFTSKSALVLTDVTGASYNKDVAEAIKDFVSSNTPFIKASAVVGVEGVSYVLLQTVIFLSKRELKVFPTRQAAMDWLASV
jgi:hypothetical protein